MRTEITKLQDLGHVGGRVGVPGQIGIYPLPTYPSGVLDTTPLPPTYLPPSHGDLWR